MRIQLGHPNLAFHPDELSPAILRVPQAADFSQLPETPDWQEIGHLALLIDGYTLAEALPDVGDLFEWFNPVWEKHLLHGGPLPADSLRLWLMLFACQRGYLRDRWESEHSDGSPSIYATGILNVYHAPRRALQEDQGIPPDRCPVYLPAPL
jgi:hypothetical protein